MEETVKYDAQKEETKEAYYTEAQHEREMTRMETANRRWFIAFMVMLILFVATNAGWIIYESQFQDVVVTQENDNAPNNYVGHDGDINNGQTSDTSEGET